MDLYQSLSLFNPDLEGLEPQPVLDFRSQSQASGGILIASPEYAHGVTGAMKNALDWVAGSDELVGKPVALLNAFLRAVHARAGLAETLAVADARLGVTDDSVAGPEYRSSRYWDHAETSSLLRTALSAFVCALEAGQ